MTTYPTEAYPNSAAIEALNSTTDDATGLVYVEKGTNPASSPSLQVQLDRRFNRENNILSEVNKLRVVKVDTTHVGVFPGHYRILGVDYYYPGEASVAITATDDTYYVYADATSDEGDTGAVTVVTDATDWPASTTDYIPLAEVTVASSVISAIADVRSRVIFQTQNTSAGAATGTDEVAFIIDQDNVGAGVSSELRFNRGATANDAAVRWNETDDTLDLLADRDAGTEADVVANTYESTVATGTAPLTVASTTKVANLNADAVDGVGLTAPGAANQIPYATGVAAVAFTGTPAADDVLFADAGVPTWGALGATSGVQAHDTDLDAVAALAATGVIARTGAGTASVRTITAGTSISVADGDGVAGNPTVSLAARTDHKLQVGNASAGISEVAVGASNTILAGNTGADPAFRQIVNADVSDSAAIGVAKLSVATVSGCFLRWMGTVPFWSRMVYVGALADDQVLTNEDAIDTVYTNGTAPADKVVVTLPAISGAAPVGTGTGYTFVVTHANGFRIMPNAADTIRVAAAVTAGAPLYIESTTKGDTIHLIAVESTVWYAVSYIGTWTVSS